MHFYVHYSIIYSVQIWKHPKCSLIEEWIKKIWLIYTMEYCSVLKKKKKDWNFAICDNMDGPTRYYAT